MVWDVTDDVRGALRRFDDVLAARDVPVVQRPRAEETTTRAAITALGLTPVEDAVVWWAFVGVPPPDEGWARFVTPRHRLVPLDRAAEIYRDLIAPPPESALLANPGWLPLARFLHGGVMVADCSPGGDGTVRPWNADSGVADRGVPLATVVEWWIGHIESGAWSWRDGNWIDTLDDARLPEDQGYSFLV